MLYSALFAIAAATGAAAHGAVTSYNFSGKTWEGYQAFDPNSKLNADTIQRPYPSYDPITDPAVTNIRCNNNGQTSKFHGEIAAGSKITAFWKQWTHAEGPVTVYLSRCPSNDCSNYDGSGDWFKIDQAGMLSGTISKGEWGNGIVLKTGKWETTIPANLQAGAYLIRHELLALHQARAPQFYPECAQLKITGSGTAYPSSDYLVKLPGAFKMADPGVTVNINTDTSTTYIVPGPKVWGGSGDSGPAPVDPVQPTTTTAPISSPTPTYTQPVVGVAKWGQCGGMGYSGSTTCENSRCVKVNDYYSQCQ